VAAGDGWFDAHAPCRTTVRERNEAGVAGGREHPDEARRRRRLLAQHETVTALRSRQVGEHDARRLRDDDFG
jgi:hypothetical protein